MKRVLPTTLGEGACGERTSCFSSSRAEHCWYRKDAV
jgi:hypothetical protein